jgi:hypothetical protein
LSIPSDPNMVSVKSSHDQGCHDVDAHDRLRCHSCRDGSRMCAAQVPREPVLMNSPDKSESRLDPWLRSRSSTIEHFPSGRCRAINVSPDSVRSASTVRSSRSTRSHHFLHHSWLRPTRGRFPPYLEPYRQGLSCTRLKEWPTPEQPHTGPQSDSFDIADAEKPKDSERSSLTVAYRASGHPP